MEIDLSRGVILEAEKPGATKRQYWVNFHDSTSHARFLGAVIVMAADPASAISECWRLKINPGGAPYFHPLDEWCVIPRKWRNRLLAKADCDRLNGYLSERLNEANESAAAMGAILGVRTHPRGDCPECSGADFAFERHVYSTLADEVG